MASTLVTDFPELAHLSREDLEDLLSDPVYFQAVFHSLSYVKDLYKSQAELGLANEAIAKNNLALQQRLYDLRSETKDAFDEAKRLEARWKELEKEQKEVYQRFSPQFLLMRLRHSTTSQDEESEALATSFVQQESSLPVESGTGTPKSGRDVDDFVKEFKELRKVYHKRALWGEKWANGQVIWRED
ncbi:Vacuolar protein sorting-associated protein 37A [Psilocybe cubensis]|uniref:Vacuolar protein sorting-associated protein 37A n=2 Tax=Psilocybe cubensis TaxID=181762 RepID=A0ACB8GYM7_PSICU|nr:Vacuolar protein sorting-associated protein 37A [Psilocybe cubensis]KAH9480585.1 Vacuolar protein sorting-associated protein 37A [Psilocybe cubensis]